MGWKGHSYGIQPEVDHWKATKPLDVAGVDIYHPSQEKLTGAETAFGGDLARSMRNGQNYLVLETQAQGFPNWTPFSGQLRLQAFSHLASGANMVEYWHWASTSNAVETYWRGVLSQDYQPNSVFEEVKTIGIDLKRLGTILFNLRKSNEVGIYVSNIAQSGFDSFKINVDGKTLSYNDVVRRYYDALYRMNVEADILSPSSTIDFSKYKLIIVPTLYAASDVEIEKLNAYAKSGGHLLYTFRSGFSDENTKVRYSAQPGGISVAAGIRYQQFSIPNNATLDGDPYDVGPDENKVQWWMEFITPTTAKVIARFKHASWPSYAAITRNEYGTGDITYVGFMPSEALTHAIIATEIKRVGITLPEKHFPIIIRGGILQDGHRVRYFLNYSASTQNLVNHYEDGIELISGKRVERGQFLTIAPWGVAIMKDD